MAEPAPHIALWKDLADKVGQFPAAPDIDGLRRLRERLAAAKAPRFWPAFAPKRPLSEAQRLGLVRMAQTIPGDDDETRILALIEAVRHAPPGDVVQVGEDAGRTGAVLGWLAHHYDVGQVLIASAWTDTQRAALEMCLAPVADGRLNLLAATAGALSDGYGEAFEVESEAFGSTVYLGRIAVLHINDLAGAVMADRVAPGGWAIFAADARAAAPAFIEAHADRIAARFETGRTIFVQLKL